MICLSCLDALKAGNLKELKNLRGQCQRFSNNQCQYLASEGSFHSRVQDAAIEIAPSRVKKMFNTTVLSILIFGVVFLSGWLFSLTISDSSVDVTSTPQAIQPAQSELLKSFNELKASGEVAEAFIFLSQNLVTLQHILPTEQYVEIRNELLALGADAVTLSPSRLYDALDILGYRESFITKVNGFVTDITEDILAGTRITVSDTTSFSTMSLVVLQPPGMEIHVRPGDEVLFLAVPEFVHTTTPLVARGWVQP
jgi:hypothetical protein